MQFDVNKYKSPYEPEAHWKLREAFITRYMREIPEPELVCLAQCFINVEILGCKYPDETMERIEELKEGIEDVLAEFEEDKSDRAQKVIVQSHSRYKKGEQEKALQEAKDSYQSRSGGGNPWDSKRRRQDGPDEGKAGKHTRFN